MLKKSFFLFLFILLLSVGCKKDSSAAVTGVPNVAVNFSIDLNNPQYVNLTVVGGWIYVTGGYDGIIVYRLTSGTFLAFDRGCPYDCESNTKAIVTVQSNNIFAICPICGTQYSLNSGAISNKGPGTLALKQYSTSFDGVNTVTVSN
jgi:hypothetical protein